MEMNRSHYNKAKREEAKGSWIQVRKGDKDNIDILNAIQESCLDEQVLRQNYQITSTSLFINTHLETKFSEKERELEQLLQQKPPQMFAFGLVRTEVHATEVCEKSAFQRQVLHAPLGDPAKGVNVVKHADVLMTWAYKKRCQRPWLIIYRIMKGRSKEVKPRFTSQAPQVNPTPNADSHICKATSTTSDLERLNQSQIFLYELDNQSRPSKHPRQCLPYAIVSYKQRAVPLQVPLHNSASQKKRVSKTSRDACSSASTSQNEDTKPGTASPSLSTDEGADLSRFLETEALSLENLDSHQLDCKLADIKREREEVMKKLKAIQSMREAITSGSCSSESEHEIDKALDKISESSKRIQGISAKDKCTSSQSNQRKSDVSENQIPDYHGDDQTGGRYSHELERRGRSASSSAWRDPYHWPPRQDSNAMPSSVRLQIKGNDSGHNLDYYNNDEQSEMFDLDEMVYASQGRSVTKEPEFKPLNTDKPSRFKDEVLSSRPGENHSTHNQEQFGYALSSNSIKTEVTSPVDSQANLASSSNNLTGGDGQLSSNTKVQDMDIDESSQSSVSQCSYGNTKIETNSVITPIQPTFQGYNSFKAVSDVSAQETHVGIGACAEYNSHGSVTPIPGVDTPEVSTEMGCPNYGTPASSDTPSSNDFSTSQVVSRDADGRLRLASQTPNLPEVLTNVVSQRPPSPSAFQFTDTLMSPPEPAIPHLESNLVPIPPADSVPLSYTSATELPSSTFILSEGTKSAIEALQEEMNQTKDPTQRCALQVAMNTLLAKKIGQPKEEMSKTKDVPTKPVLITPLSSEKTVPTHNTSPVDGMHSQANAPSHSSFQNESRHPKGTSLNDNTENLKPKVPKMFHGHPLIKKGKKQPRPILMEKLSNGLQPVDPRPARSSLFGRKLEVSLKTLPWAKVILIKKEQPKIDDKGKKKKVKPNLRDPRVCKQILTDALNPAAIVSTKEADEVVRNNDLIAQQDSKHLNQNPDNLEEDVIFIGCRKSGEDTPEPGEIFDSPLKQDKRTVVLCEDYPENERINDGERNYQDEMSQQLKILEKLKYVQDLDVSIPHSIQDRKVEEQKPQENVFNRLGNKRKYTDDTEQKFDLRQKIKGKKSQSLTGYGVRDEFLHSESSNDSSICELKPWTPPSPGNESFADTFKWYNKKPYDDTSTSMGKEMERKGSTFDNEIDAYLKERDRMRDQNTQGRSWSNDGYSKEKDRSGDWKRRGKDSDSHTKEIERQWNKDYNDKDTRESSLNRGSRDDRYRDRYQTETYRDRYSKENRSRDRLVAGRSSLSRDRGASKERSSSKRSSSRERSSRRSSSRERSSRRSLSREHSSRRSSSRERSSRRSSSRNLSSQRGPCRDSSYRCLSSERTSQRSLSRDRSSQRSESSTSSYSQGSVSKEDQSSDSYSIKQYNPSPSYRHVEMQGVRTPLSRSSSVSSSGHDIPISNMSSKQPAIHDYLTTGPLQGSGENKFESLDDRLEKEHGIVPAKKRKYSESSWGQNESPNYKNLSTSLSALKQSVSEAVRSFRDLTKYELQSRVAKYQERYKKLQDMAIRALECHYEQDRIPSEMDRDIQQRLLEMITDIEVQREGLEKYKSSPNKQSPASIPHLQDNSSTRRSSNESGSNQSDSARVSDNDAMEQEVVCSRTSPEIANQMYDRWQNKKCGTKSPARSNPVSGSSQKQRCP